MKLKSNRQDNVFYIDWWLLNHCNYNCSYCADVLKNGSIDLPNIDHCKQIVNDIIAHARNYKKTCDFKIVGGEVTVWPMLPELLEHIKSKGSRVTIRTNASGSIANWARITKLIDGTNIEFHSEYASHIHFLLMVEVAKQQDIEVGIIINMMADKWNDSIELIEKINKKWPDQPVNKKMLFEDPAINTIVDKKYKKEHLVEFKRTSGPLTLYENGVETYTDFNTVVLEGKNKFEGSSCNAGIEQIIIDAWGKVAKGHCRNGSYIGSLGKGIIFPNEPTICRKNSCSNAFDIQATKF
jgi:organic radical activating enzyme